VLVFFGLLVCTRHQVPFYKQFLISNIFWFEVPFHKLLSQFCFSVFLFFCFFICISFITLPMIYLVPSPVFLFFTPFHRQFFYFLLVSLISYFMFYLLSYQ